MSDTLTVEPASTPTKIIRRRHRKRTKLNEAKIIELAERGLNAADIAKHQGVAHPTAWRFLQAHKLNQKQVAMFKEHRADLLAGLQGNCLELQTKVIASIGDGVIEAMTQPAKTGLLIALNATTGTAFEKERLERGQSTSNQSIISKMVDCTVKDLYAPQPVVGQAKRGKVRDVTPQNVES